MPGQLFLCAEARFGHVAVVGRPVRHFDVHADLACRMHRDEGKGSAVAQVEKARGWAGDVGLAVLAHAKRLAEREPADLAQQCPQRPVRGQVASTVPLKHESRGAV
jgi:hypothetical protein